MGLQTDLGFSIPHAGSLRRRVQRFGSTRAGTKVLAQTLRPLDRLVYRLTKGKTTVAGLLGGFPIIMLTTTGARSGLPRTNPLTAIPFGDDLAIVGANYGLGVIPSWTYNLRAHPEAIVAFGNNTLSVTATEVVGRKVEEAFAAAIEIYPGYAEYRKRFKQPIPVFALTALSQTTT